MEVTAPRAAESDDLGDTIDYFSVSQDLLGYGKGRSWKFSRNSRQNWQNEFSTMYAPGRVRVEIKKFIIPEARHISVACSRSRTA